MISDIFDQVIMGYNEMLDKVTTKIQWHNSMVSNDVAWYRQMTTQIHWNVHVEKNALKLTQRKYLQK